MLPAKRRAWEERGGPLCGLGVDGRVNLLNAIPRDFGPFPLVSAATTGPKNRRASPFPGTSPKGFFLSLVATLVTFEAEEDDSAILERAEC